MRLLNRFWLFIYSTPNIVGSCMGVLGLLLFFSGLIKSFWFPIVAGLYLAGYIGCPRRRQIQLTIDDGIEIERIESELEHLVSRIKNQVLPETLEKVEAIAALVVGLLPRVQHDPHNRHTIVQTATDYLPSMLEHYLNLPPTFARLHPLKNGLTAREILLEQLSLLLGQLQSIQEDIHTGDTEALLAHSTFLKKKFGKDRSWELE